MRCNADSDNPGTICDVDGDCPNGMCEDESTTRCMSMCEDPQGVCSAGSDTPGNACTVNGDCPNGTCELFDPNECSLALKDSLSCFIRTDGGSFEAGSCSVLVDLGTADPL